MGRAAGPIRLLLAGVFLLARIALGFAAGAQPCPAVTHVQAVAPHGAAQVIAASPGESMGNAPCRPDHAMPCCCGPGLCGTALGVLPPPLPLDPLPISALAFAPDRGADVPGIRASPALPPPRI
jgi:hypothetical protein